jgi:hypothetical protein
MDSKMKMVKSKDGKMVPSFAADGKGKMAKGGMMQAKMKAGGGVHKMPDGKMMKNSAMPKKTKG